VIHTPELSEKKGRGYRLEDGWNSNVPWEEKVDFHKTLAAQFQHDAASDLERAKEFIARSKARHADYVFHSAMAGTIEHENTEAPQPTKEER
jgi:hypothetical protein